MPTRSDKPVHQSHQDLLNFFSVGRRIRSHWHNRRDNISFQNCPHPVYVYNIPGRQAWRCVEGQVWSDVVEPPQVRSCDGISLRGNSLTDRPKKGVKVSWVRSCERIILSHMHVICLSEILGISEIVKIEKIEYFQMSSLNFT